VIVHQVLSGAGPVDAVTSQARAFRALFGEWGWGGTDVAWHIDPRIASEIKPLSTLEDHLGPDDVLLIHYSAYAPRLRGVLELDQRKVLLSHNVTPARWFWDYEPTIAIHCQLGRQQLPEYAKKADVVAGVSAYNAAELGSDRVVPILFDPTRLGPVNDADPTGTHPPTLLFIGRLAPHKRMLVSYSSASRRTRTTWRRCKGSPISWRPARSTSGRASAPRSWPMPTGRRMSSCASRSTRASAFRFSRPSTSARRWSRVHPVAFRRSRATRPC
jgi:hypothetical protein